MLRSAAECWERGHPAGSSSRRDVFRSACRPVSRRGTGEDGRHSLPSGASADLVEAGEIAERGHMRLHACDVHLEGTRLCLVRGDVGGARERLASARGIVEATGYRRREREVVALERWVGEA